MKYNTIIFDLDGTLLNTLDDLADSVNIMLEREGYPTRTREDIREFIGNGAKNLIRRALPEAVSEEEVARCLAVYKKIYQAHMFLKTAPYEGIDAALRELKSLGAKLGVVSNKPHDATREMCEFYFSGILDAVIGDNPERNKKPAPDNIFEIMKLLDSDQAKTLYVGDSDVDMETAKNAGLDCAGVIWGYRPEKMLTEHGADYIIEEPRQLIHLIVY
jgi:phosphoglycolate phosphatase